MIDRPTFTFDFIRKHVFFFYFPILQWYFSFPTAMQMGASAKREDFEEDYGAFDIMSSLERDIGM